MDDRDLERFAAEGLRFPGVLFFACNVDPLRNPGVRADHGHFAPVEQPDRFNEVLLKCLRILEGP